MNFGFNLGNILTVWYFVFLIIFHLNLIVHISMSFERSHVSISGEKVNDNLNMGSGSDLEFVKIRHAFLGINFIYPHVSGSRTFYMQYFSNTVRPIVFIYVHIKKSGK